MHGFSVDPTSSLKVEGPEPAAFARLTGIALDSKGFLDAVDGDAGAVDRLRLRTP